MLLEKYRCLPVGKFSFQVDDLSKTESQMFYLHSRLDLSRIIRRERGP